MKKRSAPTPSTSPVVPARVVPEQDELSAETERQLDPNTVRTDALMPFALDALNEGVLLYGANGLCRFVNRRIAELFGVDATDLVGKGRESVVRQLSAHTRTPDRLVAAVGEHGLRAGGTLVDPVELSRPRARIVTWTARRDRSEDGATRGWVDVVRDVTRERQAETKLSRLEEAGERDPTTGLPNERRFRAEAEREHRRSQRAWDPYAIVLLDVDGMHSLNESHGRSVGDGVLHRLGHMIRSARREYDIVARYKGDQLAVLLPGASARATRTVAERIIQGVAAAPLAVDGEIEVTVSGGGAVWVPPSGEGVIEIIARAADALERAKALGGGNFEMDAAGDFPFPEDELGGA